MTNIRNAVAGVVVGTVLAVILCQGGSSLAQKIGNNMAATQSGPAGSAPTTGKTTTSQAQSAPSSPQFTSNGVVDGIEIYTVVSDYQEEPCKLRVLLPAKLDKTRQYKVIYLCDCNSPENIGIREARKIDLANKYDVICVGADFSSRAKWGPWYGDLPGNPRVRYNSYLPDVIVPFIDKTYPTLAKPEGRLLLGYSKGGHGAWLVLLYHLDVFGRAGAWDAPVVDTSNHSEFFGSDENFKAKYQIPNLLKDEKILQALQKGPARLAITGYSWGQTARAHELLTQLKIPHYANEEFGDRKQHSWQSGGWVDKLVQVLLSKDMANPELRPSKPE